MKIAHCAHFTPRTNGLFETVRDLVEAERKIGQDARIIDIRDAELGLLPARVRPKGDPCPKCGFVKLQHVGQGQTAPDWIESRGVAKVPVGWLNECDIIVSHSGIPPGLKLGKDKPRVHIAHGRPRSSFLLGQRDGNHVWAAYAEYARDPRMKALVTLWPGFKRYWKMVFPRVEELPPFVDLERWQPGATGYRFGGQGGAPNVVVCDIWRHDRDPFHSLFGFATFAEQCPNARIHIYGLNDRDVSALGPVLDGLKARGVLGEVCGHRSDLLSIYGSADMLLTPHRIATRTVREALACGLSVVSGSARYTPYAADEEDLDGVADALARAWTDLQADRVAVQAANRRRAEEEFDPERTALRMVDLLREILASPTRAVVKQKSLVTA